MSYLPALLPPPSPAPSWPPSLITYEQYETELDEAIRAHPKFGEWLSENRKYWEYTFDSSSYGFSHSRCQNSLSVQQLKDLYITETNNKRIMNHAKRHTIKQKLKLSPQNLTEQRVWYDEELKKWEDARAPRAPWAAAPGRHAIRPVEPKKPDALKMYENALELLEMYKVD